LVPVKEHAPVGATPGRDSHSGALGGGNGHGDQSLPTAQGGADVGRTVATVGDNIAGHFLQFGQTLRSQTESVRTHSSGHNDVVGDGLHFSVHHVDELLRGWFVYMTITEVFVGVVVVSLEAGKSFATTEPARLLVTEVEVVLRCLLVRLERARPECGRNLQDSI
jgi:hypothetical protein